MVNAGPHLAAFENHSAVMQPAKGGLNATDPLEKSPKGESLSVQFACKFLKELEARAGIEPAHKGFAGLSGPFMLVELDLFPLYYQRFKALCFQPVQASLNRHPLHFPLLSLPPKSR